MSHETIAERVGKSRVAVTNTMRLLDASSAVKQALVDGRITEGHARAMLSLSAKQQEELLNKIVLLDLSVRTTEMLAKKYTGQRPASKRKAARSPNVSDVERRLESSLGTKVSLRHGKSGRGTVTIYYYSDEELNSLLDKLT
jgi:ParB family chromosome partitioning protein